jgi:hypothetical protein
VQPLYTVLGLPGWITQAHKRSASSRRPRPSSSWSARNQGCGGCAHLKLDLVVVATVYANNLPLTGDVCGRRAYPAPALAWNYAGVNRLHCFREATPGFRVKCLSAFAFKPSVLLAPRMVSAWLRGNTAPTAPSKTDPGAGDNLNPFARAYPPLATRVPCDKGPSPDRNGLASRRRRLLLRATRRGVLLGSSGLALLSGGWDRWRQHRHGARAGQSRHYLGMSLRPKGVEDTIKPVGRAGCVAQRSPGRGVRVQPRSTGLPALL